MTTTMNSEERMRVLEELLDPASPLCDKQRQAQREFLGDLRAATISILDALKHV
jgi:hypothetical protein